MWAGGNGIILYSTNLLSCLYKKYNMSDNKSPLPDINIKR